MAADIAAATSDITVTASPEGAAPASGPDPAPTASINTLFAQPQEMSVAIDAHALTGTTVVPDGPPTIRPTRT